MKPTPPRTHPRERGAALLAALAFSGMTAMLVSAGLWVSSTHYSLAWSQARSESALLLAEGGVNDELAKLAENVGMPQPSAPAASAGETMRYPGENHPVYGRKGNVSGASNESYWVCTSGNEWWRSGQAPTPWDGVTDKFWVTSTAYVRGSWRRTTVQVSKESLFGQYAVYTNGGDDDCTSSGVDVGMNADVTITGTSGTNGKVTCRSGASLSTGSCINANRKNCATTQFPSSCARPGSVISERTNPCAYPTTTQVLKKSCGLNNYSDSGAWTWRKNNCDNDTGIYTYKSAAGSATLSPANCSRSAFSGTTCSNYSSWSQTSKGCWDNARTKPGTSGKVKTLIFQPGDYYFSSIQLAYDASTEIVIDSQAQASGGTPGQVRFWINDTSWYASDDNVDLPVKMTKAAGETDPDPALFRVYYAKDGHCLSFNRPSGCKDYRGYNVTGDFSVHGGVYAVTRPSNAGGCSTTSGAEVKLYGSTASTGGKSCFKGSLMCDKASFSGSCRVDYSRASHKNDPPCGAKICGGYRDGR